MQGKGCFGYSGLVLGRAFKDTIEPYSRGRKAYVGNVVSGVIALAILLIIGGKEAFSSEVILVISGIAGAAGWLAISFLVNFIAAPMRLYREKEFELVRLQKVAGLVGDYSIADLQFQPYHASRSGNLELGFLTTSRESKTIQYTRAVFRSIRSVHSDDLLRSTKPLPWGGLNDKKGEQIALRSGQAEVVVVAERDPEARIFKVPYSDSREYSPGVYEVEIEVTGLLGSQRIQNIVVIRFEFLETFFFGESTTTVITKA